MNYGFEMEGKYGKLEQLYCINKRKRNFMKTKKLFALVAVATVSQLSAAEAPQLDRAARIKELGQQAEQALKYADMIFVSQAQATQHAMTYSEIQGGFNAARRPVLEAFFNARTCLDQEDVTACAEAFEAFARVVRDKACGAAYACTKSGQNTTVCEALKKQCSPEQN